MKDWLLIKFLAWGIALSIVASNVQRYRGSWQIAVIVIASKSEQSRATTARIA